MSDIMTNDQRRLRTRVAVFACIAVAALVLDQITKAWAQSALADGHTVRVIPGILSFTLVHNPGASLGMGSNMTWLISLLAIVACVALVGLEIRAKAAELIEGGQARVLGRDISKSSTLQSGETVEFDIVEERTKPEPIAHDMAVVYEDDDVVVVDKPVGVAAHASVGWTGPTVLGSLLDRGVHITSYGAAGRQGIVSRLDVGTSGLMLVCKSDLAYVEMRRQFAEHEVVKTYHALVQGNLRENKATIEAPIGRAKVSDFRFCVTPVGKEAITHWDVMERFGETTLVSVNLETGRTHQIRVHFSSIGHPLAGDAMYGANPQLSETLGLERQWLHAMQLEFRHPRTRVWTTVKSHYPADLQHALDVMHGRHDTQDKPEA